MDNTVGGCTDYNDSTGDWDWKYNNPYEENIYKSGKEGWICPKCGRVFAPWISECPYCSKRNWIITTWDYPESVTYTLEGDPDFIISFGDSEYWD